MDWNRVFLTENHREHSERFAFTCDKATNTSTFCICCAIDILDSHSELIVRKTHILSEILNEISVHKSQLIELLKNEDDVIASHFILTLTKLATIGDTQLMNRSTQGAVQLIQVLDNNVVSEAVLSQLIQSMYLDWNQTRDVPFLNFIDNLIQRKPKLAQCLLTTNEGQFVSFLETSFVLDETTKKLVTSIIVNLVRELGWTSLLNPLTTKLPQETLKILHETHQQPELQANALTLLRQMVSNAWLLKMLFEVNAEGATFPLVLKRYLLNARDRNARLACIQCVCDVLRSDQVSSSKDNYAKVFLQNDLATFLFEAMGTVEDTVLESCLRCCLLLTDSEEFFNGCYSVYGINSIVRAAEVSLSFSNVEPSILAFNLMAIIFQKQTASVPLFCNVLQVNQVFQLLKKTLENPMEKVAIHAIETMTSLLKKQHLIGPTPFDTVKTLIETCLQLVQPYLHLSQLRKKVTSRAKEMIQVMLRLMVNTLHLLSENVLILVGIGHFLSSNKFQVTDGKLSKHYMDWRVYNNSIKKLCLDCAKDPFSLSSTFESTANLDNEDSDLGLKQLKQMVFLNMDETFIPIILLNVEFLNCSEIFLQFFSCISLCLELLSDSQLANTFAVKLASSGFLQLVFHQMDTQLLQDLTFDRSNEVVRCRNEFVKHILLKLVANTDSSSSVNLESSSSSSSQTLITNDREMKTVSCLIQEGLKHLPHFHHSEFDSIFTQRGFDDEIHDDERLESIRTTLLALCYYSTLHGHNVIPSAILYPTLTNCLVSSKGKQIFNSFNLKCIFFLMAHCNFDWPKTVEDPSEIRIVSLHCTEAIQVLVREITEMSNPARVYTHHKVLLDWVFSIEELTHSIGRFMLDQCLYESMSNWKTNSVLSDLVYQLLNNNEKFSEMFLDEFLSGVESYVSKAIEILELSLAEKVYGNVFKKQFLLRTTKMLPYFTTNDLSQSVDKTVDILLKVLLHCLHFEKNDHCPVMTDSDLSVLYQVEKTVQWLFERGYIETLPIAFKCLNMLLARFNIESDTRGANILLVSAKLMTSLESIISQENDQKTTIFIESFTILSILTHHQEKTQLEVPKSILITFQCLRNALFSSIKHLVLSSLQILLSSQKILSQKSRQPLVKLVAVSSESHTSSQDNSLLFDDLAVIYATLLNLLIKERSDIDTKEAVLNCLLFVLNVAQSKYGVQVMKLADNLWTAAAIEALVNQYSDISDLKFIAKVLTYLKGCSGIYSDAWSQTFAALIGYFHETNQFQDDLIFQDCQIKILHNMAGIVKKWPNCNNSVAEKIDNLLRTEPRATIHPNASTSSTQELL